MDNNVHQDQTALYEQFIYVNFFFTRSAFIWFGSVVSLVQCSENFVYLTVHSSPLSLGTLGYRQNFNCTFNIDYLPDHPGPLLFTTRLDIIYL